MNPFDLYGPAFLCFYLILGGLVIATSYCVRVRAESAIPPKTNLSDPYLPAYLRGGYGEASRVAVISLIDRGLLRIKNDNRKRISGLIADKKIATDCAGPPIEKAILIKFKTLQPPASIFGDINLDAACSVYEKQLTQLGLLPDEKVKADRRRRFFIGAAVLFGVAAIKIMVALSRGRHNVSFLILAGIVLIYFLRKISNPFRTACGDRMLQDLRTLFSALKQRAKSIQPGGATGELILLAGVFGLGSIPVSVFPYSNTLYPKASSSSWNSSCGTSCGSSCGSSCGGGCGGGCGGCGS